MQEYNRLGSRLLPDDRGGDYHTEDEQIIHDLLQAYRQDASISEVYEVPAIELDDEDDLSAERKEKPTNCIKA